VAPRRDAQRPLVAGDRRQEVRDQKRDGLPPHDVPEEVQPDVQRRLATLLGERQDLADHAQDVPLALLGRHEFLDLVGEDDQPDAIVVADGGERQHRRDLGGQVALLALARSEAAGRRHVDDQQHGHLALLAEQLDVSLVHARRDVPVDEADVVAGDIGTHLLERDAASLEDRMVLARHPIPDQSLGHDLDLADPLQQLAGQHDGGGARRSTEPRPARTTCARPSPP
jgi:hypothetical protein